MSADDPAFKSLSVTDIPVEAEISQRMLRRLADIENSASAGPVTPAARAALASSVIAHAVVELELHLIAQLDRISK